MGVLDHSLDVLIIRFGITKRVYCDVTHNLTSLICVLVPYVLSLL